MFKECNTEFKAEEISGNELCVVTVRMSVLKGHVNKDYSNLTGPESFSMSSLARPSLMNIVTEQFSECW